MANILKATKEDISWMVELSHKKRSEYEKAQPNFWKMSQNSNEVQQKWLEEEFQKDKVISLRFEKKDFIIGKLVNPPEVYDSGLTLMVDDFCVESPDLWGSIGLQLLK